MDKEEGGRTGAFIATLHWDEYISNHNPFSVSMVWDSQSRWKHSESAQCVCVCMRARVCGPQGMSVQN